MALPQATYSYGRNIEAPDITRAGALISNALGGMRERELEQMKLDRQAAQDAENQRRWDITNSRADALAKRQEDEYNRALAEKDATNEAYRVLMNKDQYANEKMAAEQKAIQESLAMLTPEERAAAEQGLKSYNPEVSRQQWIDNAISGPNVDQSKVVAMKTNLYNIAANTPGTPEYQAKIDADKEQKKWALALENKYKMAQLATENKNRLAQIEASKEAKPVGTDLFYVPTADGGYAPQYISKGGEVPTGAKSESIYKEMLKKNNDSSSGGGSGGKPGGTQYITGGTDLEANARFNRAIDTAAMVGGSKDASLIKNAISPGKEDDLLWVFDKSPELVQGALKEAFGDDTVELANGTKIKKYDFYSNLANNPDKYVVEYKEGSKKPIVYDKDSDAWKIKQLAANTAASSEDGIDKSIVDPSVNTSSDFSMFGIKAPTTYTPLPYTGTNYNDYYKELKASELDKQNRANYNRLPDYVKRDVSYSKYLDNLNIYNNAYLK